MQPCSREMQGMASMASCLNGSSSQIPLQELQNGQHQQQIQNPNLQNFDQSCSHDDFFDQMLSSLPSWTDLATANPKSPWELTNPTNNPNSGSKGSGAASNGHKLFGVSQPGKLEDQRSLAEGLNYAYDESALLASRLRQHQISGGGSSPSGKQMLLQLNHHHSSQQLQEQMMVPGIARSTTSGDSGLVPLPLSLGSGDSSDSRLLVDRSRDEIDAASFKSPNPSEGDGLYNGFGGSLQRAANQQHFHHTQAGSMPLQTYGTPAAVMGQAPATGGGASSGIAPPRQRVRARRGQATDPHSIAERLRRERIAERMKALQELVPNANKTDKASMLDEIIDYVKFLQLQVKVLSMSRLGGAAAVAPLVADISHEVGGAMGRGNVSSQGAASGSDSLTVTEHQVAKLMEEDMGSAMQYLQGKGLCLMPISLASAISTATCHSRTPGTGSGGNSLLPPHPPPSNADGPSSPSMSVLTVQSAMANGAETDISRPLVKDAASVSKQ